MRNSQRGVDEAFEAISLLDQENKLTIPLKAFFGRKRSIEQNQKKLILLFLIEKNKY